VAAIQTGPHFLDVQRDRDATIIHTSQPEHVLRQLFQLDIEISQLEGSSAGLEEALLALTSRQHDHGGQGDHC
jgi:hypothetical protein